MGHDNVCTELAEGSNSFARTKPPSAVHALRLQISGETPGGLPTNGSGIDDGVLVVVERRGHIVSSSGLVAIGGVHEGHSVVEARLRGAAKVDESLARIVLIHNYFSSPRYHDVLLNDGPGISY